MDSATPRCAPEEAQTSHQPLFARTPMLHVDDPQALREVLRDYFVDTFDRYESLFETLACDEGPDFRSFRIGLFGLDKLKNIDRTVATFEGALKALL